MTTRTPTAYQLQAAVLSARAMASAGAGLDTLRSSYEKVVTGGLYRTRDLEAGQDLLERAQLISIEHGRCRPTEDLLRLRSLPDDVAVELLLQEVLAADPPLWLYAAVAQEEVRWENVPDEDARAITQLIAEPERREAILLALGRVVDQQRLKQLGAAGEEAVVVACREHLSGRGRPDLAGHVERVSLRSDQLGYDVTSPDTGGTRHRIEVKATQGMPGQVEFYLSRNEATVGGRDPCWSLVAVRKSLDGRLEVFGWCRASTLAPALPTDGDQGGRWESVRISLPDKEFRPGLPLDSPWA
jgi:hypothetical protein